MPTKGDQIAGSDTQMAAFLFGLARGATVEEAAAAAEMKVTTLYYRRKRCPVFAKVWHDAVQARADVATSAANGECRSTIVRWHPGRGLMRKRKLPVEFDRERKQVFLDHFAATCNLEASAGAAGISLGPVYRSMKADPAFLEGFEEALRLGYLCLEAEALREQREAQQVYRLDPGNAAAKAQSFERTMQLLREYKRAAGGTIGRRADRSRARWTFDATIDEIEKKLKAFGVEIPEAPTPQSPPENPGGEE